MTAQLDKRFRFTAEKLESIPLPTAAPSIYYDSDCPALGIRVQPTGRKSFFVLKQVAGRPQRKTLGPVGELKLDAARKHAWGLLNQLADWKADGAAGLSPLAKPEKGFSFSECFEAYCKYLHAPREKRTVRNPDQAEKRARWLCDTYLAKLKTLPLESITATRLEALHRAVGEKNGHVAANRAIELIRATFRFAFRKKLTVLPDPTGSVSKYSETKRTRFLQPDELVRLHEALEADSNADLRDFITLLLATGVRKSSLYAARFDEVSEAFQTWNIPVTKNGDALTVQLTPKALAVFAARKERLGEKATWVFPSAESKTEHITDYKNQWRRVRKAANIPDVSFHDLRRTNASYQAISGASLAIVGASLGHKSLESTQVYARLHGSAVRQSLLDGEAMQKQMMATAQKQMKAAARKAQKSLPEASVNP